MRNKDLFSIGEASKITGMHVKSLRYYDRIRVFSPDYVDPRSGYRYYSFEQLQSIMAVRTCLDTGIVLSELEKYRTDDGLQYAGLISHARNNIEKKIQELQTRLTYLDFMEDEVSFNDNKDPVGRSGDVYGSIALWTVPLKV